MAYITQPQKGGRVPHLLNEETVDCRSADRSRYKTTIKDLRPRNLLDRSYAWLMLPSHFPIQKPLRRVTDGAGREYLTV